MFLGCHSRCSAFDGLKCTLTCPKPSGVRYVNLCSGGLARNRAQMNLRNEGETISDFQGCQHLVAKRSYKESVTRARLFSVNIHETTNALAASLHSSAWFQVWWRARVLFFSTCKHESAGKSSFSSCFCQNCLAHGAQVQPPDLDV